MAGVTAIVTVAMTQVTERLLAVASMCELVGGTKEVCRDTAWDKGSLQ